MNKINSKDYHDYVIKEGKFIGAFEDMYQNVEDPWHHGDATAIQYDIVLSLIGKYNICKNEGSIFDIGCGKGSFSQRINRAVPNAEILAIDISKTAIEKAKEKYDKTSINFQVMDIQKEIHKLKDRFDLIIISQIMWYILPDFGKISKKLKRLLKHEGYIIINQAFYKQEEQKYGTEIIRTVDDMLKVSGYKVIEMIELNRFTNYNFVGLLK